MMFKNKKFSLFIVLFSLAILTFVLAAPTLAPNSFSVNQSVSKFYNITVNNSEAGSVNITEVNITIPAGFSFTSLSNTSTVVVLFSNTSTILRWNSTAAVSAVRNVTNSSFGFNATANATTIGTFNFTVSLVNNTGVTYYNISVTVNDTMLPSNVSFVSPTFINNSFTAISSVPVNVSITDNNVVGFALIRLYNSTSDLVNSTIDGSSPYTANFTGHSDGVYFYNVTVNDTTGNTNSSFTFKITLDTTTPSVSIAHSSQASLTQIAASVTVTESGSGLVSCSIDSTASSPSSWTSTSQTITESGIECGQNVTRIVSCTDYAGNVGNASKSLGTDDCVASSSSSNSASATDTWKKTFVEDTKELVEISKDLASKERIRVLVNNQKHTVGVLSLTASTAKIEVASTPQEATMNVGNINKFDTNSDDFYDTKVTLNSISSNKADITVTAINEAVPAVLTETKTNKTETEKTTTSEAAENNISKTTWIIIIVGLIVVIALATYFTKRRKSKYN